MIVLGVLLAWVLRIATKDIRTEAPVISAAALLISILFSAILSSERIIAVENDNDCIKALLLSPADSGDIYIAKLLVNITMLIIFEIVTVPVIFALFRITAGRWAGLAGVIILVNIGICGAGTLLGAIAQAGRAANSLLSILVLVIICPIIIPAISALELLLQSTGTGPLLTTGLSDKIGFLVAFDAIFVTVCWLLFGFVLSD
jgi:heme exporter protein B